jgi:hypothetical protein
MQSKNVETKSPIVTDSFLSHIKQFLINNFNIYLTYFVTNYLIFYSRYCLAHPIPIHPSGVDDDVVLASGFAQRAQDEETPIQTLLPRMVRMADGSGCLHGVGLQVSLLKRYFCLSIDKSRLD